jgi:hypothetical protein
MQSIPAALTWETFDRSRWSLPAAALGALAFPVLILSALSHEGALDPSERYMLMMHFVMVQMNILIFGSPLVARAWKMSRLYPYPASSATLVTWRMLPIMVATFVETALWTAALNILFELNWPLWGPALLSAVTIAAVLAAAWLTAGSRWIIFAITVLAIVLSLGFKSRYGGMFSNLNHHWATVTPSEIFTMLLATCIVWRIAVAGVARSRRGEPPFSLGVIAWFESTFDRLLDRSPSAPRAFRSPVHAQFWYHWRHGLLAPAIALAFLLVGLTIWLFSNHYPQDLVAGVYGGVAFIMCAAFVGGVAMADLSPGRDTVMGQFLATRPMTPADQARTILRATAATMLLAWAVWAVAAVLAYGVCAALGAWPSPLVPEAQDWRQIPAAFVGSWICAGNAAAVVLAGRPRGLTRIIAGVIAAYIVIAFTEKYAPLSSNAQQQLGLALGVAFGLACLLGTIAAFVAARRRALVEASTAWAALAVWAALVIVAVLVLPSALPAPSTAYIMLAGVLALAVIPLAAAPLALAWNRHR